LRTITRSIYNDRGQVYLPPEWWRANGNDFFRYSFGIELHLADSLGADQVLTAMQRQFPAQVFEIRTESEFFGEDPTTVQRPIAYESSGVRVTAVLAGLAALIFVGQALARQVRREWTDASVLRALGMGSGSMRAAAASRALGIAVLAAGVAVVVMVLVSPLGPVGLARHAEVDRGFHLDLVVVAIGIPTLAATVLVVAVARVGRISLGRDTERSHRAIPTPSVGLPAPGVAGWALGARSSSGLSLGTAVLGTGLAVAAVVAAWSVDASLDRLVEEPHRFGAPWDATVGNISDIKQLDDAQLRLDAIDGLSAAFGILSETLEVDGQPVPVVALESYTDGQTVIEPTMTSGRPPIADDEIVLAAQTRRQLGVDIGDRVRLGLVPEGDGPPTQTELKVVGEAVLSDGLAVQPGKGALVTAVAIREADPSIQAQILGVRLAPGVHRDTVLDEVRQAFPTTFAAPTVPSDIRNLVRIAALPPLLAGFVVVLAVAALTHALVLAARRHRLQLAVLKSIGFTRGQIVAVMRWHASSIALLAAVVGVPLGVIAARVLWGVVVERLGVAAAPVVPVAAAAVVGVAAVIVANLVAAALGWSAARDPIVAALRTE
jgi:putative ABC transport system permease protein